MPGTMQRWALIVTVYCVSGERTCDYYLGITCIIIVAWQPQPHPFETLNKGMATLSYEKPVEVHSRMVENNDFVTGNTSILPGTVN